MNKRLFSFFLLSLLVLNCLAFFPVNPVVKADSGTWYVNSSYDDTYEIEDDSYQPTNALIKMDDDPSSPWVNTYGGVHFDSVSIPQGSTVSSATVQLYIQSTTYDDCNFRIYGDDVDDSVDFQSDPEVNERTRTTANQLYTTDSLGAGWYAFTVTSVVSEIIGREGWNSGNGMTFMFITLRGTSDQLFCYSYDYGSAYRAQLDVTYTPPPDPPTYDSLDAPSHIFYDEYIFLNATVSVPDGHVTDLVNCTIGLNDGIILKYDNATDIWSEYADPSSYVVLNDSACVRTSLNSTQVELSFNVKFVSPCPPERKDASASTTKVFQSDDQYGSRSSSDWFYLWRTGNVLGVEDGKWAWGFTNASGAESILNQTSENDLNLNATYDNSTLTTRGVDYGSSQTNYATLYVIDHSFVWGWSDTLYDIYRYSPYECYGECEYGDWLYNGLIPPSTFSESYPNPNIPWYVPIIGYLAAVILPFMIIAYYWNKARDWKTGMMVLFVCIMMYILFMVLWNLSDALMYWMYQ